MPFELPPLPFAENALEPYISAETVAYHYGKHHRAYVNKLNTLIAGTEYEELSSLPDIIKKADGPIFNNAAQAWNHAFYWYCLEKARSSKPSQALTQKINDNFGSLDAFFEAFKKKAMGTFGSGWVWLVRKTDDSLEIVSTGNAGVPLTSGQTPLLTCDVWEHAYYIDTRNDRALYLDHFRELINWGFVERNLTGQYDEKEASVLF